MVICETQLFHKARRAELTEIFKTDYRRTFITAALEELFKFCRRKHLRKLFRCCGIDYVQEPKDCRFDKKFLGKQGHGLTFYYGVWASEKYYEGLSDIIRSAFTFPQIESSYYKEVSAKILKAGEKSVSVHVRRGDYVKHPDFDGIATEKYYAKALEIIREEVPGVHFFIFSNDPGWCRKFISAGNTTIIDPGNCSTAWVEMFLMSQCRHHINANSTFSWWGSWLGSQDGMTLCPDAWWNTSDTPDFYPDRWVKVDRQGNKV